MARPMLASSPVGTTTKIVLAALLAAAAGCLPEHAPLDRDEDGVVRIAVAGDSNSSLVVAGNWVRSLERYVTTMAPGRWAVAGFGIPNAGIVPEAAHPELAGVRQVERILAMSPPADVAVLAFGTNDHLRRHSPREILGAYREQHVRLEGAGIAAFVALTPPCFLLDHCNLAEIAWANDLLRAELPDRVVDFWSWVEPAAHMDAFGLHFNAAGHGGRFAATLRTLAGWAASRSPRGGGRGTPVRSGP